MSNYNTSFDEDEEDFFGHRHNFSALNSIKMPVKTEEDFKKEEIMKAVHKYPFLFTGMYDLLYQAAIAGEDLDQEYEDLKGWMAFM
jgi:hypothetical protein